MAMQVRETGCCGMKELVDISYVLDPEAILKEAADGLLAFDAETHRPGIDQYNDTEYTRRPASFAVFTEVVERKRTDHVYHRAERTKEEIRNNPYGGYNAPVYVQDDKYGENLANYIRANNLGSLIISEVRINSVVGPEASDQSTANPIRAYIWSIDRAAYEKWYTDRVPPSATYVPPRARRGDPNFQATVPTGAYVVEEFFDDFGEDE